MRARAQTHLDTLGVKIKSVDQRVDTLSGGQRQSVAVSRSVFWGRDVVIMDEPTAALSVAQSALVLGLIKRVMKAINCRTAIDVGANVGRVSERLLKCGYTVYAFEPYGPSFRALRERLTASQKFHAFDFALGPEDGTMNLHIASDLSGVSKWDPSLFHSLLARPMLCWQRQMLSAPWPDTPGQKARQCVCA